MSNRYRKLSIVLLAVGMIVSLAACGTVEQTSSSTQEQSSETAVESAQIDTTESSSSNEADTEQTEIELSFGNTGLMEPIGMRNRMKTGLRVIRLNNEEKD